MRFTPTCVTSWQPTFLLLDASRACAKSCSRSLTGRKTGPPVLVPARGQCIRHRRIQRRRLTASPDPVGGELILARVKRKGPPRAPLRLGSRRREEPFVLSSPGPEPYRRCGPRRVGVPASAVRSREPPLQLLLRVRASSSLRLITVPFAMWPVRARASVSEPFSTCWGRSPIPPA